MTPGERLGLYARGKVDGLLIAAKIAKAQGDLLFATDKTSKGDGKFFSVAMGGEAMWICRLIRTAAHKARKAMR